MFIAALVTMAKTWRPPLTHLPELAERWKRCGAYMQWTYTQWTITLPLKKKKEWNNTICSIMDEHRDFIFSKSDRNKYISYEIIYLWNLTKWYKWTYLQNRNILRKQIHDYKRGREWGTGVRSLGLISTYYLYRQKEKRAKEEGWDGWMASPIQWTWTWENSERWWGTGRPGML